MVAMPESSDRRGDAQSRRHPCVEQWHPCLPASARTCPRSPLSKLRARWWHTRLARGLRIRIVPGGAGCRSDLTLLCLATMARRQGQGASVIMDQTARLAPARTPVTLVNLPFCTSACGSSGVALPNDWRSRNPSDCPPTPLSAHGCTSHQHEKQHLAIDRITPRSPRAIQSSARTVPTQLPGPAPVGNDLARAGDQGTSAVGWSSAKAKPTISGNSGRRIS
jgi:hypothetical protein